MSESPLHCVIISCFREHVGFLQHLLSFSEIRLYRAETLEEADFLLTVSGASVLISDVVFLDGTCENALEMLCRLHSGASLLVAAEPVDFQFAARTVERGACAILRKPLDFIELARSIRAVYEAVQERSLLHKLPPVTTDRG